MLVHALYNAILLFLATYHADNADLESFLTNPAVLLIAGGVLAFGLGAQRRLVKGG
jgi:hypothetical protein